MINNKRWSGETIHLGELAMSNSTEDALIREIDRLRAENEALKKQLAEVKLELQMQKDGYIR